MAAGAFTFFNKNRDDLNINALVGATVKFALVSSAYTPNVDSSTGHAVWGDVSANEISAAGGYSAGGATIANDAATAISGGFKYTSDNVQWSGPVGAWRYAVVYVSGSLWSLTNPLVGYFVGDSTPADIPATTTGNTLTLICPSGGWFDDA